MKHKSIGLPRMISILFWLFIGVAVTIGSVRVGIGSGSHPQPGFMSFFAGLLLIGLTLLLAFFEIRKAESDEPSSSSLGMSRNFLLVLVCLVGYALVLEKLGYLISIGLFVFVTIKMRSPGRWLSPFLWSLGISFSTYLLFSLFLKLEFPKGIFDIG